MPTHNDLAEYLEQDQLGQEPPAAKPERSPHTRLSQFKSEMVRLVMEIFPGARWTTRDAYRRLAAQRDKKWRKTRG